MAEDSLQGIQFECWTGKMVFAELGNCVIVLIKMHFILHAKVMATQQRFSIFVIVALRMMKPSILHDSIVIYKNNDHCIYLASKFV